MAVPYDITVEDHASGSVSGGTIGLPAVHVGYLSSVYGSSSASVSNASGNRADLETTGTVAYGSLSINNVSGVAPGGSALIAASLAPGQSAGAINQTFNLTYADDSSLDGASNNVGSLTITVTGSVYSGQGVWAAAGAGNWNNSNNWTAGGGVPGIDGPLSAGDTATFGNAIGSSSAAITLDTAVTVSGVTFSNTGAGVYVVTGTGANTLTLNHSGSGATIAVSNSGLNVINAPVILADNLTVSGSGLLAFGSSSSISGPGYSLTMDGPGGTLILSGSDTYSGGTNVEAGTLEVTSLSAIEPGTSLTVGVGGASIFALSRPAAVPAASPAGAVVAAVPEPGTLALLLAGLVVGFAAWRRRKIAN